MRHTFAGVLGAPSHSFWDDALVLSGVKRELFVTLGDHPAYLANSDEVHFVIRPKVTRVAPYIIKLHYLPPVHWPPEADRGQTPEQLKKGFETTFKVISRPVEVKDLYAGRVTFESTLSAYPRRTTYVYTLTPEHVQVVSVWVDQLLEQGVLS